MTSRSDLTASTQSSSTSALESYAFIRETLVGALVIVLVLIAVNAMMSAEGLFGFGVPTYHGAHR